MTPLPRSQFWSGRVNLSFWVCHPAKSLNRHRPGNIKSRTLIIFLLLHTHKHPNTPMSTAQEPPIDNRGQPPSTLHRAKVNAAYLLYGSKAAVAPASLTTRSALTTTRYVLRYVVRRLLRYTKYALIGGCLAAVGGGVLGTIGSGLAFFAAPSIGVGMGIGVIAAVLRVCFINL